MTANGKPDLHAVRQSVEPFQIVILDNTDFVTLDPMTLDIELSELPIADKPLLQHAIEFAVQLRPARLVILSAGNHQWIRSLTNDGARWGIQTILERCDRGVSLGPQLLADVLDPTLATLVLTSDCVYNCSELDMLHACQKGSRQHSGGMMFGRPDICFLPRGASAGGVLPDVGLVHGVLHVRSPRQYYELNLRAARGQLRQLRLRSRKRAPRLSSGPQSRISPLNVLNGKTYSGPLCQVHPTARFYGTVVLGRQVIVGRHTDIEDSVILDNTFIGSNLSIRNSLVKGEWLMRMDTGTLVRLHDDFVLSSLHSRADVRQVAALD